MLDIVFISDYVCPYCLVAKDALKLALEETGLEATIRPQPFELSPDGRPQVDTYHDEVRRSHYQVLIEPCRRMNLDMKLPPHVVPRPRTRLAFEGWFYAQDHGCADAWNDRMYRAYFLDELDIGDPAVLKAEAIRLGMDGNDFAAALAEGRYTRQEQEAVAHTRAAWTFKGVPAVFINGEPVTFNDYTKEEAIAILTGAQQLADAKPAGAFCDENGCHLPGFGA